MEEYTPIIEKDKKTFSFKRTIQIQQKGSQIFSFTIIKSEEDIEIKIKEEKENLSFKIKYGCFGRCSYIRYSSGKKRK